MSNASSRSQAWKSLPDGNKLDLIINELDEFDARQSTLVESIDIRLSKIEKRSAWTLATFVGLLMALLANVLVLLITLR